MKKKVFIFIAVILVVILVPVFALQLDKKTDEMVNNIHWLGHATVKILVNNMIIYIDPAEVTKEDKADLIFVTHPHEDHFTRMSIKKILTEETILVSSRSSLKNLKQYKEVKPGDKFNVKGIDVEVVYAYNIGTGPTKEHLKADINTGYVLTINGTKVYYAGSTDRIPEMKAIKADIAILPVGGVYTMTPEEASQAALDLQAKVVIPVHWGKLEGTRENAEKLVQLLKGKVQVVIKEKEV